MLIRQIRIILIITLIPICSISFGDTLKMVDFLKDIGNLAAPVKTSERVIGQRASTDQKGFNEDWTGTYPGSTDTERVLARMDGPGCVLRIWSANPDGVLNVYVDGKLIIDMNFVDIFGSNSPYISPICSRSSGGWNSYFPIPYSKSCLITCKTKSKFYYQVTYATYPKSTSVESYNGKLSDEENKELLNAKQRLDNPDEQIKGKKIAKTFTLKPGDMVDVFSSNSSGIISKFTVKPDRLDEDVVRGCVVRMYWEGESAPSVECPLGDFFGTVYEVRNYDSLYFGMSPKGELYSRYPMPYKKAKIQIINQSYKPVNLDTELIVNKVDTKGLYRFHVRWQRATTIGGISYNILKQPGRGNYITTILCPEAQKNASTFLEGDEQIYVDTNDPILGTGTEDYFDGGWYFGAGELTQKPAGCVVKTQKETFNHYNMYRIHLPDYIPFTRLIDFNIEHCEFNNFPGVDYVSTAFWYQDEPHSYQPLPEYVKRHYLNGFKP